VSWSQFFLEPIVLADGRVLRSLRDAGEFIQSLPKVVHERPEWREAVEALLLVVERDGDMLPVRVAIVRALNAANSEPQPRRKRGKKNPIVG
jgi:hypothetical protein